MKSTDNQHKEQIEFLKTLEGLTLFDIMKILGVI